MTRPPHIAIRADAFAELGGGHIMRCLSLAHWLAAQDCRIVFACAPGSAELVPALARSGFTVLDAHGPDDLPLPEDWPAQADAVFVDLYNSTRADETRLRARAKCVAVIEDLDDRPHDCDLLVDPGAGRSAELYVGRMPPHCRVMAGPEHALLREEFPEQRAASLARRTSGGPLRRVLVSMGLTDIGGVSQAVTRIVMDALPEAQVDVVLGPGTASRPALDTLAAAHDRLRVLVDIDDMAARMAAADIAVGAGGGTALERCVLGLPSIAVALADNQRPATRHLAAIGALYAIDSAAGLEAELPPLLARLTPQAIADMSRVAATVCDGRGVERVGHALLALVAARTQPASAVPGPADPASLQDGPVRLRRAGPGDIWLVYGWRNRPHVRRNMYTDHVITQAEHAAWYGAAVDDPTREVWIIECDGAGIGTVLIDAIDRHTGTCSWAFYIGVEGLTGRGIGSRVEGLVIRHVFEHLGLDCLRCEVLEFNTAVIGLHRKFGFRETGRIENRVLREGQPAATICLELRRSDWLSATRPTSHG